MKFLERLFRVRVVTCALIDRPTDVANLLDRFVRLFAANALKTVSLTGFQTVVLRSIAIYSQHIRDVSL